MAATRISRMHRLRWGSAAWAGVLGGTVFLALEILMVPVFLGGSAWGPLRMIAAIVMGETVLPPPATFEVGVITIAAIIHVLLSAVYGLILGVLIHRMASESGIITGAVFGLVLYFVNFYLMTAVFPWFAMGRNWVSVFAHIAYGIATAAIYYTLARGRPLARAA